VHVFGSVGKWGVCCGVGLGASVARKFAQGGYTVALVARKPESLTPVEEAIKKDGGKAISVPADTGKQHMQPAKQSQQGSEAGICHLATDMQRVRYCHALGD
jgi:short-subunit dehydrogenase